MCRARPWPNSTNRPTFSAFAQVRAKEGDACFPMPVLLRSAGKRRPHGGCNSIFATAV